MQDSRSANSGAETDCEAGRGELTTDLLREVLSGERSIDGEPPSSDAFRWRIHLHVTVQGCRLFTDHRFNHIKCIRKTGFHHKDSCHRLSSAES